MPEVLEQKPIEGMEDEFAVPEAIQEQAEKYKKALKSKNNAAKKCNAANDSLISAMQEAGINKVRIQLDDGKEKIVEVVMKPTLKIRKPKPLQQEDEADSPE